MSKGNPETLGENLDLTEGFDPNLFEFPNCEERLRVNVGKKGSKSIEKKYPGEDLGARIAKLLVGYTNSDEQQEIRNIINGVTDKNVIGLLKGYYDNIGFTKGWGDAFFHQIWVEHGFKGKLDIIHKVGYALANYAEKHNNKASARAIRNICDKETLSSVDKSELHTQHMKILKDAGVKVDF